MKNLALLALCLLSGCVGPAFVPYVGQQKVWKHSDGGFVQSVHGVDLYSRGSYPSQNYTVLGAIVAFDDNQLADCAKAHKADAVVILDAKSVDLGTVTTGGDATTQFYGNTAVTTVSPSYSIHRHGVVLRGYAVAYHPDIFDRVAEAQKQIKLDTEFLAWAAANKDGWQSPDGKLSYTAQQIASRRESIYQERELLIQQLTPPPSP